MPTASIIDSAIGSRLRAERISRRLDPAAFADGVGVTPERLETFETGVARIDAQTMVAICKRLNVDVRFFFHLIDTPSTYTLAAE